MTEPTTDEALQRPDDESDPIQINQLTALPLPPEIIRLVKRIIKASIRESTATMMRRSKALHDEMGRGLYESLKLVERNVEGVLLGLGDGTTRKGRLLAASHWEDGVETELGEYPWHAP